MNTEVKDPKETVRALIDKAGNGLDNPMLVAIAEAAPSPKAADKYVTETLGWPNEVGRVVRDMVRLHQTSSSEGAWKGLVDSQFCPSAVLFKFNEMHKGLWFETGLEWAGEIADRSSWPLFLRELHLPSTSTTTYDGRGDAPPNKVSELDLNDSTFTRSGAFCHQALGALELSILVTAGQPTDWRLAYPKDSTDKTFEVNGKSVTLLPNPPGRIFPEFWKVLQLKKDFRKNRTWEEILITMRRDLYPTSERRILGNLIYRKYISLRGAFKKAILEISYLVWPDFDLTLSMNGTPPISVSCDKGELSPNISGIHTQEIAKAVENLANTVLKILYPPSLKEILGRELVENPPETLAELLMRK